MSTVAMQGQIAGFLKSSPTTAIYDLGCGFGAQSFYFAECFPQVQFIGLDYNHDRIAFANELIEKKGTPNIEFHQFDIYEPKLWEPDTHHDKPGVISIHTLCCFKNFSPFFEALLGFSPEWLVVNSLFWNGPLEVLIHIRDLGNISPDDNPDSDFNVFSKELVSQYLYERGYESSFADFHPNEKLPKPPGNERGTYTIETEFSRFTQFSGPVHLPWSFMTGKLR